MLDFDMKLIAYHSVSSDKSFFSEGGNFGERERNPQEQEKGAQGKEEGT